MIKEARKYVWKPSNTHLSADSGAVNGCNVQGIMIVTEQITSLDFINILA